MLLIYAVLFPRRFISQFKCSRTPPGNSSSSTLKDKISMWMIVNMKMTNGAFLWYLGVVALPECAAWSDRSYILIQSGQCRDVSSVSMPLCQMRLKYIAIDCLKNGHHPFLLLFFMQCYSTIMVHHSSKLFYSYLYIGSFVTLSKALYHSCFLSWKENKSTFLITPCPQNEKSLSQISL